MSLFECLDEVYAIDLGSTIRVYSRKANKLRNMYTIKTSPFNCFKIKVISFFLILTETVPFVIDKSKFKKGLQRQSDLLYLTEVFEDII